MILILITIQLGRTQLDCKFLLILEVLIALYLFHMQQMLSQVLLVLLRNLLLGKKPFLMELKLDQYLEINLLIMQKFILVMVNMYGLAKVHKTML